MFFFILIIIIIVVVLVNRKKNEKWYEDLSIKEKTEIKQLDIKLAEVNLSIKNTMPKKYKLYKLLLNLSNNMVKEEEIIFFSRFAVKTENSYAQGIAPGYIYITNKKILIVDKESKNIPFEKISSIGSTKKELIINNNATSTKLSGISKSDVIKIIRVVNDGMEKHKNISINLTQTTEKDISDKIARLKALYDDGILTEYEFEIKKKELLEKVK